jgi:Ca2+-binding EF-hand superfamily protein
MPLPAILLALLAPSAQAQVPSSAPIVVTAHPWAPFISPMGEPFRARSETDDTLTRWFRQADRDGDGVLTAAEMQADAERFFATLDTDHDGEIDPDELANYEYEIAPDVQVMSRTKRAPGEPAPKVIEGNSEKHVRERGKRRRDEGYASLGLGGALQGAARYSLLNIPEPVAAADTDFNRSITFDEFRQAAVARFQFLDSERHGRLSLAQLLAMTHVPSGDNKHRKVDADARDTRIGNPLPTGP